MTDLLLQKTPHGFKPADRQSHEAWQRMERGTYRAKVTRGRNLKFHKKYFALLQVTMANLPEHLEVKYPAIERLRWELTVQTGHFDMHQCLNGTMVPIPHSIKFAKMPQEEFERLYDDTVNFIVRHILTGIDEAALREAALAEVSEFAA